jgi:hypothetical protein
MKRVIALLIVVFLFTGATSSSKSASPKPVIPVDKYEQLPDGLDRLADKMETVSSKFQKRK